MSKHPGVAVALLALTLLSGCGVPYRPAAEEPSQRPTASVPAPVPSPSVSARPPSQAGEGALASEDRDVPAGVTRVVLRGSGTLTITIGDTPSLRVTAEEGVLGQVRSDASGATLHLGVEGVVFTRHEISYDLVLPALSALTVHGSGSVLAEAGSGPALAVDVNGSGEVELRGAVERLELTVDGSGEIRSTELAATDATAAVRGSGTIEVAASGILQARVAGSGTILYSGDASVNSEVSGSGVIRRR